MTFVPRLNILTNLFTDCLNNLNFILQNNQKYCGCAVETMANPSPQPSPMPPPPAPSPMGPPQTSPSPGMIASPSQTMVPLHHSHSPSGYHGPPPHMMNQMNGPNGPPSNIPAQGNQGYAPHNVGPVNGPSMSTQSRQVK